MAQGYFWRWPAEPVSCWSVKHMDQLGPLDLDRIEQRLDAFGEWFARVIDGAGYDRTAAMEDYRLLAEDQRMLIEQARRAHARWIELCR